MNICKKCNNKFEGNYCFNCGHPLKIERINSRYIISEIASVLNFQKGIFHTIKELLIKPGQNIRQFISEDRNRLVKPILFIIICSLTYTVFVQIFEFKDGYINFHFDDSNSAMSLIFQWITQNYGYSNILMAVFVAIWIKMFYRKYDYNFYEILILLLFISGMQMLMFALLGALESLTKTPILTFGTYFVLIYAFWAIGQFFDKRKILNYAKAPISYFLGLITFFLAALGIGLLIDLIK
nr:DUF3667 domain-containing protein [uncultured Draconibacterium sp.]